MVELLKFFFQLSLLRRAPQDLPGSRFLLLALLGSNFFLSFLLGAHLFRTPLDAVMATGVELLLGASLLYAALYLRDHAGRWQQAYSALLGLGILAVLVASLYRAVFASLGLPAIAVLLDLVVFVWMMMAMSHVLRHTLDILLPYAILVVFAYTMLVLSLIGHYFPPIALEQAVAVPGIELN